MRLNITLCLILLLSLVFSLGFNLPSGSIWQDDSACALIFWQLRLPRVILALACGAALATAGVVMQALFRNPLAEAGLMGVSSGAALGFGLGLSVGLTGIYSLPLSAFACALLFCALAWGIAKRFPSQHAGLILAGVALNALANSLLSLISYAADDHTLRSLVFWGMGSLSGIDWPRLLVTAPILLIISMGFGLYWRSLNAWLLGEHTAQLLGFNTHRLRWQWLVLVALLVGISVALCGVIGFIGLLVPHTLRLLIGGDHQQLLPSSALAGATLLLVADTLAQWLIAPAELPVGLITSLLGAPFFLWLLWRDYAGSRHA